ncbi:MAG: cobalamin-dependent protein, partial [Sedimenticola sp.]|nr:cobalamin-dependent protein [Sedimenticola sp.]
TVKGDVHDIGKNIVGVVLQCNSYEVIDLGVMVPAETILQKAIEHKVDIIGLSGLITPSLDEMVHIPREMERLGMHVPLLIGGATTSLIHTAVKIHPRYSGPSVYVPDASRAVGVASNLLSADRRDEYISNLNTDYADARDRRATQQENRNLISLSEAQSNPVPIDWTDYLPPAPLQPGVHLLKDIDLAELLPYIDWTFFFHAWELRGSYPKILQDPEKGVEAQKLFNDAQSMLQQIIDGEWLKASAVVGILPANSDGDDVEVYKDDERQQVVTRFHFLRKQGKQPQGRYNDCLADFIAPKSSAIKDYIGGFACTTGIGIDEKVAEFEANHDDYSAIMLKALADRLAEALAEKLHLQVRKQLWGYASDEALDNRALIKEQYQGIRPAIGYPASPDHTEKRILWDLLDIESQTGIWLTESMAMVPTAAVSGLYFSHPEARYFAVGKMTKDQIADYANRKQMTLEETERWLAPNLGYEPS